MFRILFLFFVIVPIIEITVLIHIGELLGAWPTIAIVIFTAWLGAKNVRQQGIATLQSVQNKMSHGEMPSGEIITGLLLLIAGILLVTPGFVTDIFGLLLLVPKIRALLINTVQQHIQVNQVMYGANFTQSNTASNNDDDSDIPFKDTPFHNKEKTKISPHKGQTIDGEFERKE